MVVSASVMQGYRHTQNGPWSVLLYGFGALMLVVAALALETPLWFLPVILAISGTMMLVFGTSFQRLTVSDDGDALLVAFGPLPLFRKRVRYEDIRSVEPARTTLLDGWGIHMSLRGGWVWNISGRDCVLIRHGGTTWLGTDDVSNLVAFLKSKAPAVSQS